MRQVLALVVVSAFAAFSIACAYENPTQPLPTPVDTSAPFALTMGTSSNTITAHVQNANGAPLGNIAVRFATNVGSVSPSVVTTSADGKAATTLTAGDTATVTATVGSLSAHSLVAAPPAGSTPPPPGSTTPAPASAFLNVSPNGTVGVPVTFSVSSSAPGPWSWSFGDGVNTQTSAFTTTHTYGGIGTYVPSVSSSATTAASATVTIGAAAAPATPLYTVSLAASPTSVTAGGSATLTASVTQVNGAPAATSFAWDCDGNGTTDATTAVNITTACAYPTPGIVTSRVTVTGGTVTGSATTTVTVTAVPAPVVTVTCPTVTVTHPTTCNVSATFGGNQVSSTSITITAWDWGNGTHGATGVGSVNQFTTYGTSSGAPGYPVVVSATVPGSSVVGTGTGLAVVQ